jgi:hypothetical protein
VIVETLLVSIGEYTSYTADEEYMPLVAISNIYRPRQNMLTSQ